MARSKEEWIQRTGGFPLKAVLFAQLRTIPKPSRTTPRAVVVDIETEIIDREFTYATTARDRTRQAPAPSIACAYSTDTGKYTYYRADQFGDLLRLLRRAPQVVSYNGERFDFFVMAKTLNIGITRLKIRQSTDLYRIIVEQTGERVSQNNLSVVNLGETKHTAGNRIPNLEPSAIKTACKSDVNQLYRLYKLYSCGRLRVPLISLTRKHYNQLPFRGICPICKDAASIVEMPYDTSQMTEGQLAEYLAGTFGTIRCTTCNTWFEQRM